MNAYLLKTKTRDTGVVRESIHLADTMASAIGEYIGAHIHDCPDILSATFVGEVDYGSLCRAAERNEYVRGVDVVRNAGLLHASIAGKSLSLLPHGCNVPNWWGEYLNNEFRAFKNRYEPGIKT